MGLTMATQFLLIEHGQELLPGSLGVLVQVGDHLGGRGKGVGHIAGWSVKLNVIE